jgi:hypothetical protein
MMKNVAIKVVDRLFVVVYGTAAPSDAEWDGYLAQVERQGVERTVQLIYTDGGEPTAGQRQRLNDLLAGRMVPVAVVTSDARVRRTVTVLSWFNRKIKAFRPGELCEALAYLEIPQSRAELIDEEVRTLRASLGRERRATA